MQRLPSPQYKQATHFAASFFSHFFYIIKSKMNTKPFALLLLIMAAGMYGFSQNTQPAVIEDFKPSSLNQPGQEYPQVNSQGYARFKIIAPSADSVKVSLGLGGRGGTKLTRAADSSWMGTTEGPMDEGFRMVSNRSTSSSISSKSISYMLRLTFFDTSFTRRRVPGNRMISVS